MRSACAHWSYVLTGGFMITFGTISRVSVFVFMKHTLSLSLPLSLALSVTLLLQSLPPRTQLFQLAVAAFTVHYSLLIVQWKDRDTVNNGLELQSVQLQTRNPRWSLCLFYCGHACVNMAMPVQSNNSMINMCISICWKPVCIFVMLET